jgi:inorganic pyrophosphatase
MNLEKLPTRSKDGAFHVVVESPRGSQVKLKYKPELGAFTVSRPLMLGLTYPFDWGFVPSTRADDGDAVDAMLLWEVPTSPGVVVPCRAVAVVRVEQDASDSSRRQRNDRVLAVPMASARGDEIRGPEDIAERVRKELERFFVLATGFSGKNPKVLGWGDGKEAEALIDSSRVESDHKRSSMHRAFSNRFTPS